MGEFSDIKKLVDWCAKTGLQVVQILPINDSGEDPSPYRCAYIHVYIYIYMYVRIKVCMYAYADPAYQ